MNTTYLWIDLGALIVPLVFSFHPKLRFWQEWERWLPAILLVGAVFVVWDVWFTDMGVWGFNPMHLMGIDLLGLPLEELLFFFCIPFACLFTYHCFNVLIADGFFRYPARLVTLGLLVLAVVLATLNMEKAYTLSTFLFLAILLVVVGEWMKVEWLQRFYFTYLVVLVPFFIVNGLLTGTGITEEVVWYDDSENLGMRILTIPFEDAFYGMALILGNVLLFETFKRNAAG